MAPTRRRMMPAQTCYSRLEIEQLMWADFANRPKNGKKAVRQVNGGGHGIHYDYEGLEIREIAHFRYEQLFECVESAKRVLVPFYFPDIVDSVVAPTAGRTGLLGETDVTLVVSCCVVAFERQRGGGIAGLDVRACVLPGTHHERAGAVAERK